MRTLHRVTAHPENGTPIALQHVDRECLATMLMWVVNAQGCQHGDLGACASFDPCMLGDADHIFAFLEDMGYSLHFSQTTVED